MKIGFASGSRLDNLITEQNASASLHCSRFALVIVVAAVQLKPEWTM
jgi:hypothetical protein